MQMDHQRIPQQALYWQIPEYKRGPGSGPRSDWRSTVNKDLPKDGVHLGGSKSGSSWQTRSADQFAPLDTR